MKECKYYDFILIKLENQNILELRGIDPRTSHMLSERSTIWATAPYSPPKIINTTNTTKIINTNKYLYLYYLYL